MSPKSIDSPTNSVREANAVRVDGRLYSQDFKDYYAARNPVQECGRVHVGPAQLSRRFREASTFSIFEFGLGAGINFLVIGQAFLQHASSESRLRYFSCEAAPLSSDVLEETVRDTAKSLVLSDEWMEKYPPPIAGIHRRFFANQRIELTIVYGTAQETLEDFCHRDSKGVDAWILDGFAPDRNPDMWSESLLGSLASRSKIGATVTSFSSAGHVRRTLASNGFSVEKVSNIPYKRHTTLATLAVSPHTGNAAPSNAVVVGGGFAGCSTARALAQKGIEVELRTPSGRIADATSEIPIALVHGRLSASADAGPSIRVQSHLYSQSLLRECPESLSCGAIQFPSSRMTMERLERICNLLGRRWAQPFDVEQVKTITGLNLDVPGAYFPQGLIVNGFDLCSWLVDHPGVQVLQGGIPALEDVECPHVIATGASKPILGRYSFLEVTEIEGQMDQFVPAQTNSASPFALLSEGYVVSANNTYSAGSTYEYKPWIGDEATVANRKRIDLLIGPTELRQTRSFRGKRAVTSDRLPIVGRVDSDIWLNLGHGSSGTTSAPYCAEILANEIAGELPPIEQVHRYALAPDRFKERQTRRENPFLSPARGRR